MNKWTKEDILVEVDVIWVNEKQRLCEEVDEEERFFRKKTFFDSGKVACWLDLVVIQLLQLDDIISLLDHFDCLQNELVSNGLEL